MTEKHSSLRLQLLFLATIFAATTYIVLSYGTRLAWSEETTLFTRDDTKSSGLKSFLKTPGFKVLVAVGVFVVLNVVVITVHHVAQKISRSTNLYRSIDHVVSPF